MAANRCGIEACAPGVPFNEPHLAAVAVMVQGLLDLKLLRGDAEEIIETGAYREFCPHNTSHWLGSDVHDVGDYRVDGAWRELEPGMVLTIEPGIYIPYNVATSHLAVRWRGVGVRVEDDVAITANGHEVLTDAAKEVADIEAIMASGGPAGRAPA